MDQATKAAADFMTEVLVDLTDMLIKGESLPPIIISFNGRNIEFAMHADNFVVIEEATKQMEENDNG